MGFDIPDQDVARIKGFKGRWIGEPQSYKNDVRIWDILSLGAGVQSSALALMAASGELGRMPDAAIFADTGDEPASVYRWLDWLEKQLPYPVHRVRRKMKDGREPSLSDEALRMRVSAKGSVFSQTSIPLFTLNVDGSRGMIKHRSCTADFKIKPILKMARSIAGVVRGQKYVTVRQWIGISLDELKRMKPSRVHWQATVYPLVTMRLSRRDCLQWLEQRGYPTPPRSACVYCPFHSDTEWRSLKKDEPEEFEKAVCFERDLQIAKRNSDNFKSTHFLHRSLQLLHTIDFENKHSDGPQSVEWDDECEGMCGL